MNLGGNTWLTINPGIYSQITVWATPPVMNPGVYIITGAASVGGSGTVTGNGVILQRRQQLPNPGALQQHQSQRQRQRESDGTDLRSWRGILIFQARDNTRAMSFSGSSSQGLLGTIYAPAAAITLSGNAEVQDSLIVSTLTISGSAVLTSGQAPAGLRTDSSGFTDVASSSHLREGNLTIFVDNRTGSFTAAELGRVEDAIAAINAVARPYGANLTEVDDSHSSAADFVIDLRTTTPSADTGRSARLRETLPVRSHSSRLELVRERRPDDDRAWAYDFKRSLPTSWDSSGWAIRPNSCTQRSPRTRYGAR